MISRHREASHPRGNGFFTPQQLSNSLHCCALNTDQYCFGLMKPTLSDGVSGHPEQSYNSVFHVKAYTLVFVLASVGRRV